MDYELDRDTEQGGQPSLVEMTDQAIYKMKKSKNGFILMIEGGIIDHAHHANRAKIDN